MNIVPEEDKLIVEAYVRPTDVDNVNVGQEARLAASRPSNSAPRPSCKGEVIAGVRGHPRP